MTLGTVLIVLLILALLGAMPSWNYSNRWGYGPSGVTGALLVVVIALVVTGHI